MKYYVITIMDNPQSVQSAEKCIKSGTRYGHKIVKWKATTPSDNIDSKFDSYGLPKQFFMNSKYSREDRAMSAFFSHFSLWSNCVKDNETYAIFEHDAIVTAPVPDIPFSGCMNIGTPSYGSFTVPSTIGKGPLVSKRYFPGAHAYLINPSGARKLISAAKMYAAPTDIFLHVDHFSFLEEYYPWVAEARDSFTTIQKRQGCVAKHNFGEKYEII